MAVAATAAAERAARGIVLAGGKVTHFDRVEWTIMPDPATKLSALQRGEIDHAVAVDRRHAAVQLGAARPVLYATHSQAARPCLARVCDQVSHGERCG